MIASVTLCYLYKSRNGLVEALVVEGLLMVSLIKSLLISNFCFSFSNSHYVCVYNYLFIICIINEVLFHKFILWFFSKNLEGSIFQKFICYERFTTQKISDLKFLSFLHFYINVLINDCLVYDVQNYVN